MDPMGDRMKRYEAATRYVLPPRTYTVVRVDGRAFHTYTRGLPRPFCPRFADAMDAVARALCEQMSGSELAYVQSDEASVVLTDFRAHGTQPWFGGSVQKIASVAASIATAAFPRVVTNPNGPDRVATFDARVFTIPSSVEVVNYLVFRQRDATRNSILSAGAHHLGDKACHGRDTDEIQELMFQRKAVNWNDYPARFKRGRLLLPVKRMEPVLYTDRRTGEVKTTEAVERTRWEVLDPTPIFTREPEVLRAALPPLPALEAPAGAPS